MKELSVAEQTNIRNEFEFRNVWDEQLQKDTLKWVKCGRKLDSKGIPILNEKIPKQIGQLKEQRKKRNFHKKRGWIDYTNQPN